MDTPNYITLDKSNIKEKDICCAFSDKKSIPGYQAKKDWLTEQFSHGYVFRKLDVRHKVFIEYGPAETAWAPIQADGYNMINCFWAAGSFKGKGHGKELLNQCINDSKNKNGVTALVSDKKRPFLNDKKFFLNNGFEICDYASPYFELAVLKNNAGAPSPEFLSNAKAGKYNAGKGFEVFYSDKCPFTKYYIETELQNFCKEKDVLLKLNKIESLEQAKSNPSPFTIFSLFCDGNFITHEILTTKKFEKIAHEYAYL